mmetsp:Transcript_19399/g.56749  ORF Transcript_19399/g.56749 Transcript_19399/m.56749 type:complete len:265 (-) Transcript_19399:2150-2944(-)
MFAMVGAGVVVNVPDLHDQPRRIPQPSPMRIDVPNRRSEAPHPGRNAQRPLQRPCPSDAHPHLGDLTCATVILPSAVREYPPSSLPIDALQLKAVRFESVSFGEEGFGTVSEAQYRGRGASESTFEFVRVGTAHFAPREGSVQNFPQFVAVDSLLSGAVVTYAHTASRAFEEGGVGRRSSGRFARAQYRREVRVHGEFFRDLREDVLEFLCFLPIVIARFEQIAPLGKHRPPGRIVLVPQGEILNRSLFVRLHFTPKVRSADRR